MRPLQAETLVGAVSYADGQFDDGRYAIALAETFSAAGGDALNYARVIGFGRDASGRIVSVTVADQASSAIFQIRASAFVNATGPFSDAIRQMASQSAVPRMRPSKGSHILFPLDGFPDADALLVPKTEDGRVIFAIPWNGRLLVGTTDTGYKPGEEMVVTAEEIDYLLRQLNPYLSVPLRADQVVSGFAGVRPLVAAQGVTDTKKLIRDEEVEFDPESGLISILGGKWTTYRMMAEETVDKAQEYLKVPHRVTNTREHPLAGAEGYHWDYWQSLVAEYGISPQAAHHLARKYGTMATDVLELARSDSSLAHPLVTGEAPIRAQVVYAARREMAITIEDVLMRRIGLQLYGWRLAIQAAPAVAELLAQELDWTTREQDAAVAEYAAKINHLLAAAGQAPESLPAARGKVLKGAN
jgi:glycerol-3-phosphate dehydrogenase